ncbi:hypothetical protein ACE38W_07260 [Chitinophaga sp. Hz27]|uniref:hypothetical protein n=1 Tax=Chitinophaga sp. Hz27 TaxID=3347169 RepID=UPI0035DDBCE8
MIFPFIVLTVLIGIICSGYYRHRYVKKRWIERLKSYGFKVISLEYTWRSFPLEKNSFRFSGNRSYPIISYYAVSVRVNDSEPFVIQAAVKDYWYKFEVVYKDRELPER